MKKSNVTLHVVENSFKSVFIEFCNGEFHYFETFKAYQKYAEHKVNVLDVVKYGSFDEVPSFIDESALDVLSMI